MKLASAAGFNRVEEYESDSEISDVDTDSDSEDLIISKASQGAWKGYEKS